MKVLVTVGTGAFDELISACDNLAYLKKFDVTLQIGKSTYIPRNFEYFTFIRNIDYSAYDLIISHAGTGSVFGILELGINLIVVPNLYRKDKHQNELARYLKEKSWCLVCDDISKLGEYFNEIRSFLPNKYEYECFFGSKFILDRIFTPRTLNE
jgi:UDP-N-acetylglucosamine transferase subunit ALG13